MPSAVQPAEYRPLAALTDAVQIVRGLLRHETVTYRGRAFSADRVANAEGALVQAAMAAGLDAIEATRTVRSGIARGARDGRRGA